MAVRAAPYKSRLAPPLLPTPRHHLSLTPLTPVHRQEGEHCIPAAVHKHGSALPRRGRGRPRPGRAPLPLLSLWPLLAPPLPPHSPAAFCRCFLHSRAAEDSPELNHGRGEGADHAAVVWSRPSTRNAPQCFPTPSAVFLRHLRHLPCPQVSCPCSSPSPARRHRPFLVVAVRDRCGPLDLDPTVAYRFVSFRRRQAGPTRQRFKHYPHAGVFPLSH